MDLALTADTVTAARALSLGLVTRVSGGSGREAVLRDAVELAEGLAAKPALALRGTKRVLLHARWGAGALGGRGRDGDGRGRRGGGMHLRCSPLASVTFDAQMPASDGGVRCGPCASCCRRRWLGGPAGVWC